MEHISSNEIRKNCSHNAKDKKFKKSEATGYTLYRVITTCKSKLHNYVIIELTVSSKMNSSSGPGLFE